MRVPLKNYIYHFEYPIIHTHIHIGLEQGWSTQLHYWANIPAPILKRAAKLLLMTNSHYFTSNFFENLIFSPLYPPKAYPPEIFPTSQQN